MWKILYNFFLPLGFLFFLPGLIIKYRNRGGWKSTYAERFGRFTPERCRELAGFQGAVWIHAVSVGETVVALSMIRSYLKLHPGRKFVISTTTTTGQELARKNCPENCTVIFAPIDFPFIVKRTLDLVQPAMLAIFETELWPNLIWNCRKRGIPVALVNGRISDHSRKGYCRFSCFFRPLLEHFSIMMMQSAEDEARIKSISPDAVTLVTGNLKFDQQLPDELGDPGYEEYFGTEKLLLLGASTHSGEEALIAETYAELKKEFPALKLVLVPRHAERAEDVTAELDKLNLSWHRRTAGKAAGEIDVLVADTTGEMLKLMSGAHVVIMGKSLAGHDEGHNLIEPALLHKPVVTGHVLRNFRVLLDLLRNGDGVVTVAEDRELLPKLAELLRSPELRKNYGERAFELVSANRGAAARSIAELERLMEGKN
ncbi:MAG: 3-deoxy-D-manno-octulosonic acid transferase [Lentisphaeria bacterium]|nr:3-deoxy-D-manno-octulosonic acid transferase [Lentisphaeria bacterium]